MISISFTMLLAILGCSDPEVVPPPPPHHPRGGPSFGEITWWTSPDVVVGGLESSLDEWSRALECGVTGKHVESRDDARVVFEAGDVPDVWNDLDIGYFKILKPTIDDPRKRIILDEWNDESLPRGQSLHIWGHILGYSHVSYMRPSVLDSEPLIPINHLAAESGLRDDELISIKAWAIEHGAPGCEPAEDPS